VRKAEQQKIRIKKSGARSQATKKSSKKDQPAKTKKRDKKRGFIQSPR
jgi:hypothetical protein